MKLLDSLVYYPPSDFNEVSYRRPIGYQPNGIAVPFSVLQALYGELLGMFRDRLASEEHVQQFEAILRQTMRKYFGKEVLYMHLILQGFRIILTYAFRKSTLCRSRPSHRDNCMD